MALPDWVPTPPGQEPLVVLMMNQFRQRIINEEAQQLQQMAAAWVNIEQSLNANLDDLLRDIFFRIETGESMPMSRIVALERYLRLRSQVYEELGIFMDTQSDVISRVQQQLIDAGLRDSEQLLTTIIETGRRTPLTNVDFLAGFDILPVEAVQNMVGLAADGSPLRVLLDGAITEGATGAFNNLIEAIALGSNPRVTARKFYDGLAGGLNRAMVIARTEQLRVYRETTRQQYINSGVVEGYQRLSARDTRVCPACLFADDGTIYPLDVPFDEHPQGRCAMIPVVPGIDYFRRETGQDWFERQPEAEQINIIGAGRHWLYKNGHIQLKDIVRRRANATWGGSLVPRSLKDLLRQAGLPGIPKPEPQPTPGSPGRPIDPGAWGDDFVPPSDKFNYKPLDEFEKIIVKQTYESGAIYDDKGNLLYGKDGEKHSVNWREVIEAGIFRRNKNLVMTHNHPNHLGFSGADLSFFTAFAERGSMKFLRAIGKAGAFIVGKGSNWDTIPGKFRMWRFTRGSDGVDDIWARKYKKNWGNGKWEGLLDYLGLTKKDYSNFEFRFHQHNIVVSDYCKDYGYYFNIDFDALDALPEFRNKLRRQAEELGYLDGFEEYQPPAEPQP